MRSSRGTFTPTPSTVDGESQRAQRMNAIDYARRAEQHKPTDERTLRAAAVELSSRGLTPRDVGEALRLDPTAVRRLIGESGERR
jgi:hypothetical protein